MQARFVKCQSTLVSLVTSLFLLWVRLRKLERLDLSMMTSKALFPMILEALEVTRTIRTRKEEQVDN